ncbi:MAG: flavin reductase family protein [Chloroflexi bacterium]|nr:flavin reductase family protein [Chloroflexota bacterium]
MTSKNQDGSEVSAATVNWLTRTSFAPPLVAVGVKGDSGAHAHITDTGVFAVNVIGKDQLDTAFTSFKTLEREGDSFGGQTFVAGPETGCALLTGSPAWWECKVVGQVDQGNHTLSWARSWKPGRAPRTRQS